MNAEYTFEDYQKKLAQDKFMGLSCADCNAVTTPPQAVCCKCGSKDLSAKELSKSAILKTFTVIRVAPEGMNPPYIIALAETDEGPWVMGNLIGIDPEKTDMDLIGKKVSISSQVVKGDIYAIGDIRSLTFRLQ
jgi:uncharacterized OB-fold protein